MNIGVRVVAAFSPEEVMARPLRIEYPGAFYHVTSRGNEQKDIFKSQRERERKRGQATKQVVLEDPYTMLADSEAWLRLNRDFIGGRRCWSH